MSCGIRSIVTGGVGVTTENCLTWNVTNIGRQPVVLTHIGGRFRDKSGFMVQTHVAMPQTLQPGQYFIDWMDDFSNIDTDALVDLSAYDSIGNTYKASIKDMKEVKEEINKRGLTGLLKT